MDVVNASRPSWLSFLAWPLIGAALSLSVLGAMTIGIYVLPFAIAGLLALRKWGGNQKSSVGLISGAGLPVLYVAYHNRQAQEWRVACIRMVGSSASRNTVHGRFCAKSS